MLSRANDDSSMLISIEIRDFVKLQRRNLPHRE